MFIFTRDFLATFKVDIQSFKVKCVTAAVHMLEPVTTNGSNIGWVMLDIVHQAGEVNTVFIELPAVSLHVKRMNFRETNKQHSFGFNVVMGLVLAIFVRERDGGY